jgi:triacylglycerol lipase
MNPDNSVLLSGATNNRTGCIGHLSMPASSSVYAGVRNFVG